MGAKELAEKKAAEVTGSGKTVQEMQKDLEIVERTTGPSGAVPFTPKAQLLDASDTQAKHPDKRLRWGNVGNKEKMDLRVAQGYERVPAAEGGRQVGNLALIGISKTEYQKRVRDQEQRNKDRLNAHKTEVEQMAEGVARELRDRHGIHVSAENIIIRE